MRSSIRSRGLLLFATSTERFAGNEATVSKGNANHAAEQGAEHKSACLRNGGGLEIEVRRAAERANREVVDIGIEVIGIAGKATGKPDATNPRRGVCNLCIGSTGEC